MNKKEVWFSGCGKNVFIVEKDCIMFKPLPSRTVENEKDTIIMFKLLPRRRVKRDYVNFFFIYYEV